MYLKDNHSIVQDNHSNNHNEEYHTPINNTNDREDKNQDESDRPLQLNSMESNKTVNQGCKIILPVGLSKSMRKINIISCSTTCYRLILISYEIILTRDVVC